MKGKWYRYALITTDRKHILELLHENAWENWAKYPERHREGQTAIKVKIIEVGENENL